MKISLKSCLFAAGLANLIPGGEANAANYTFCMFYHASTEDSGNGEDYYRATNWWRARGAKVRVRSIFWPYSTIWDGYANESNGCFSFSSSDSQFYVDLYAETKLGPSQNVTIQALMNTSQSDPLYWTILSSPGLSSGTHYFYGPASDISNLIAIASFSYYWFDRYAGTRNTATRTTKIFNLACPTAANNSCNWDGPNGTDAGTVYVNPSLDHKKFHIAHEMGHQIYGLYRGDGSFGIAQDGSDLYCTANVGGSECTYSTGASNNEHSLHSKEWQSCALGEGFAHFVATDVFNSHWEDDGYFHYYKSGYPTAVNVENGNTGGATRFMENECTGTNNGYGVELDWLRAFWDYHTNPGAAPNHHDILDQIQATHDHPSYTYSSAYFRFWEQATNDGFGDRWVEMAEWNGIDHY